MRGLDALMSETAEVPIAEIVAKDDEEVRALGSGSRIVVNAPSQEQREYHQQDWPRHVAPRRLFRLRKRKLPLLARPVPLPHRFLRLRHQVLLLRGQIPFFPDVA